MKMRRYTFLLFVLLITLSLATATNAQSVAPSGGGRTYVISIDPVVQRAGHSQTGVTMAYQPSASTQSGVSLVAKIDTAKYNLSQGTFTVQSGTMHLSNNTTTNPSGADTTGSTPYSIYYACSNTDLSVTQWQVPGINGLTLYQTQAPNSGETIFATSARVNLTGRWLGLFIGHPSTGTSQFCLPGYTPAATQVGEKMKVYLF